MDFVDSPEKDQFPGLYAEGGATKKDDSDFSEGDHEKLSKKDILIGRRKDKKDKKDLKYATLGESSPEDDIETKSPSKSKKSKAFKFTSSKSKEKKDKLEKDEKLGGIKEQNLHNDGSSSTGTKEKENKKKEKDKKEKKDKSKDKDKKDKKSKQQNSVCEEILELGDIQPVFGCSVSLATQRSRSHDGTDVPLIVRDCIDYLQQYGLQNDQIYKVEPLKSKLQHFKRLYNNRESNGVDDLDTPIACGLLKMFLRELPEPILTTDLITRFEETAMQSDVQATETELKNLIEQLPSCNKMLLIWILLHFDSILQNEKVNKINSSSLAMLLSPSLQMSHRLLVTLLSHCNTLFPDARLIKYVPPITSSSPKLPDSPNEIQTELSKQESLLAQIHAEMNAGFVSKRREEMLWEVSRIITQLKRKLRFFEKRQDTVDTIDSTSNVNVSMQGTNNTSTNSVITVDNSLALNSKTKSSCSDDESSKTGVSETKSTPTLEVNPDQIISQLPVDDYNSSDKIYIDPETQLLMVPESHPQYLALIRFQLENNELLQWKSTLQAKINAERSEILKLKKLLAIQEQQQQKPDQNYPIADEIDEYEKIINNFIQENNLLEHKKFMLAQELFEEKKELIQLQVELALQDFIKLEN